MIDKNGGKWWVSHFLIWWKMVDFDTNNLVAKGGIQHAYKWRKMADFRDCQFGCKRAQKSLSPLSVNVIIIMLTHIRDAQSFFIASLPERGSYANEVALWVMDLGQP